MSAERGESSQTAWTPGSSPPAIIVVAAPNDIPRMPMRVRRHALGSEPVPRPEHVEVLLAPAREPEVLVVRVAVVALVDEQDAEPVAVEHAGGEQDVLVAAAAVAPVHEDDGGSGLVAPRDPPAAEHEVGDARVTRPELDVLAAPA